MSPHKLLIPEYVWDQTLEIFAPFTDAPLEAGCIWYGKRGEEFNIACVVGVPKQENNPLSFHIDADSLAELSEKVSETGLTAVAQVHIHPGVDVEHSSYDDRMIVSRRIHSLVLPFYAKLPCDISDAGVHVFRDGSWQLLDSSEAVDAVQVIPTLVDMR